MATKVMYGPLPSARIKGFKGAHFMCFPIGVGLSSLAQSNGFDRLNGNDRDLTRVADLMLQLVLQTFEAIPSDGGMIVVHRLPEDDRNARENTPFSRLVGPYISDVFVAFSVEQAIKFAEFFDEIMNPAEDDAQKKKRRRVTAEWHSCSRHYVSHFSLWTAALDPLFTLVFGGRDIAGMVDKTMSTTVPTEDGGGCDLSQICSSGGTSESWESTSDEMMDAEDDAGMASAPSQLYRRAAHPLVLFEINRMVTALLADKHSGFNTKLEWFIKQEGSSQRLVPHHKLQDSAICIEFNPRDAVKFFLREVTKEIDASKLFAVAPLYLTPSDDDIDLMVREKLKNLGEAADHGFTAEDSEHWTRRMIYSQHFSPQERKERDQTEGKNGVYYIRMSPAQMHRIDVQQHYVGAHLGEKVLRDLYPRLSQVADDNRRLLELAIEQSPKEAVRVYRRIVLDGLEICSAKGSAGIPVNLCKLVEAVRSSMKELNTIESKKKHVGEISKFVTAWTKGSGEGTTGFFTRRTHNGEVVTLNQSSLEDIWLIQNLEVHFRLVPTQISVFVVTFNGAYRVLGARCDGLNLAFLGKYGGGKSYAQKFTAGALFPFLTRTSGTGASAQGDKYATEVTDLVVFFEDENPFFDKKPPNLPAQQISEIKSLLAERAVKRTTVSKYMDTDGVEKLGPVTLQYLARGLNQCNANHQASIPEVGDRWNIVDVMKDEMHGGADSDGPTPHALGIATTMQFKHGLSQIVLLPEHFCRHTAFKPDTSLVAVFKGLLQKARRNGVRVVVPNSRRAVDFRKMAEARAVKRLSHSFRSAPETDKGRRIVFTQSDLEDFMIRGPPNLVASPEDVISAYFLMNPIDYSQGDEKIDSILFGGSCLMLLSDSTFQSEGSAQAEYKWPWHQRRVPVCNNTGFATRFEKVADLAKYVHGVLAREGTCPSDETIAKRLEMMFVSNEGKPRLMTGTVAVEQRNGGMRSNSDRIGVSVRAVRETSSPLELAMLSGLLDLVANLPIDEIKFGRSGNILIPMMHPDAPEAFQKSKKIGDKLVRFVHNPLAVLDPHQTGGRKEDGDLFTIYEGVAYCRIRKAVDRIRALSKLVGKDGQSALEDLALLHTRVIPEKCGNEQKGMHFDRPTIHAQVTVIASKNVNWVGAEEDLPLKIRIDGLNEDYWTFSDGTQGRGSEDVLENGVWFNRAAHPLNGKYVELNLGKAIDLIDDQLTERKMDPRLETLIRNFYDACHGKAFLDRKKPTIMAGSALEINGASTKTEYVMLPYKKNKDAKVQIRDIVYFGPDEDNFVERFDDDSDRKLKCLVELNASFPGKQETVVHRRGKNLFCRQLILKFASFFGSSWIGCEEAEALIDPSMWELGLREVMNESAVALAQLGAPEAADPMDEAGPAEMDA